MNTETEYILVPLNTAIAMKLSDEHILNENEMAKIVVHRKLLKKFIEQKALSMQFDIGNGGWKGKETLGLAIIEALADIAKEIGDSKDTFELYVSERNRKEKEEEEKKAEKQKEKEQ